MHLGGWVFGAFGEASPDVHKLVGALSVVGASRQRAGRRSEPDSVRGGLAWLLKRRWALTAARAAARLTFDRLSSVGTGASAAMARRAVAECPAARARRAACAGVRGPRVLPARFLLDA